MALVVVGFPSTSDEPQIDPPDLSWMQVGQTFEYLVDNGTGTLRFNVTIADITSSILTFDYWRTVDGETDVFITTDQHNETRLDQGIDDWYSHIWVNGTNLNDGYAMIDTRNFTMDDDPLVVNHVFTNGSTTFTYDEVNAYLIKADYGDGTTVDLVDTRVLEELPLDGVGPVDPADCQGEREKHETDTFVFVIADVALCMDPDVSAGNCDTTTQAGVAVVWPMWRPIEFEYEIWDHNDGPFSDIVRADIDTIPAAIVNTPGDRTTEPGGFQADGNADIYDTDTERIRANTGVVNLSC